MKTGVYEMVKVEVKSLDKMNALPYIKRHITCPEHTHTPSFKSIHSFVGEEISGDLKLHQFLVICINREYIITYN